MLTPNFASPLLHTSGFEGAEALKFQSLTLSVHAGFWYVCCYVLEAMNIGYVTAIAALAGAALGGLTSFATSWTTLQAQTKAQRLADSKSRRQELYKQFTEEASKVYVDSLMHDKPEISGLVGLYALISRMRIQSTIKVTESASSMARLIADTYFQPNKSFTELQAMVHGGGLDPLRDFSEVCRNELESDFFV